MALRYRVPTGPPRLVFEDQGSPLTEGLMYAAGQLWGLGPRLQEIEQAKQAEQARAQQTARSQALQERGLDLREAAMQQRAQAKQEAPKLGKLHKSTDPLGQTIFLRETPEGGLRQIEPEMLPQPEVSTPGLDGEEASPDRSWAQFWQDAGSAVGLWDPRQLDPVAAGGAPVVPPTTPQEAPVLDADLPWLAPSEPTPGQIYEGMPGRAMAPGTPGPDPNRRVYAEAPVVRDLLAADDPSTRSAAQLILGELQRLPPEDYQAAVEVLNAGGPEAAQLAQYLGTRAFQRQAAGQGGG